MLEIKNKPILNIGTLYTTSLVVYQTLQHHFAYIPFGIYTQESSQHKTKQNRNRVIDTESKQVVTKGRGMREEINR